MAWSRRITLRTTPAGYGSLTQARGDADGFLQTDLRFETVGEPALLPEERVSGKAQRFGLDVARGVAEEELMRLAREVVGDAAAERNRVEGRPGADGLRHDLGLEGPLELHHDRAHSGLRRGRNPLHRGVDDRHPHRRRLDVDRARVS